MCFFYVSFKNIVEKQFRKCKCYWTMMSLFMSYWAVNWWIFLFGYKAYLERTLQKIINSFKIKGVSLSLSLTPLCLWCADVEWRASQEHPDVFGRPAFLLNSDQSGEVGLSVRDAVEQSSPRSPNGLLTLCLNFTCNRQMHCKLQMFCTYFVYLLIICLLRMKPSSDEMLSAVWFWQNEICCWPLQCITI